MAINPLIRGLQSSLDKNLLSQESNGWRELVFFFTISSVAVLGFLAIVPSAWLSIQAGDYLVVLFDLFAYACVIGLLVFRKHIPYKIRAWALVAIIGLAAWVLIFVIPSDQVSALFWLFLVPPVAGILLGVGWGATLWALNVGVIALLTYLVSIESHLVSSLLSFGYGAWITHAINFLTTNALLTVPLSVLLYSVETSTNREEKLREDYQLLFENNPLPMWVYDLETLDFLAVNKVAINDYGYSQEEFLSMSIKDIRPEEEIDRLTQHVANNAEDQQRSGVWKHQKKNGVLINVEIFSHGLDFSGRSARLVMANNITERIKAEKERGRYEESLRKSESEMRIVAAELGTKLKEITILHEVSSVAAKSSDVDYLLAKVTNILSNHLYSDHIGFGLYDDTEEVIRPHPSYHGLDDKSLLQVKLPLVGSVSGKALRTGKPIRVGNTKKEVDYISSGRQMQSELTVPILVKDERFGVINAESVDADFFTDEDERLLINVASQISSTIQRISLLTEAILHAQEQEGLRAIDAAITSSIDLAITLEIILKEVVRLLDVDAAEVLVLDRNSSELVHAASTGFEEWDASSTRLNLGEGLGGRVAETREALILNSEDEIFALWSGSPEFQLENFKAAAVVPLVAKDKLKGVLVAFNKTSLPETDKFMRLLLLLGGQTALAINHVELFENLQNKTEELRLAYDATIEGWARALSLRDDETVGHSRRVTINTVQMAKEMGMSPEEIADIRRGALLHDIGKMGIPDEILLKPGPLDDEEMEIVKKHPVFAHEMLHQIDYLKGALDIPVHHHEKWDGTGYPEGLQKEEIPFVARLFAIIDVWDALTSNRPYREAMPHEKARKYMLEQSGKHFDPNLFEVFIDLLNDGVLFPGSGAGTH